MNYYELLLDGSVGRFTTDLKVAEANNLKYCTEEEILVLENKYYLKSKYDEIVESDEYKEEQKQKERERLDSLFMTRSDFFDGMIMAFGLDNKELRVIIENILNSINITDVEIKVALNNYDNALNFYRKHTLFTLLNNVEIPITEDITLIFSSEIWDNFFDTKDYTELQKAIHPTPKPEEPTEEVENE